MDSGPVLALFQIIQGRHRREAKWGHGSPWKKFGPLRKSLAPLRSSPGFFSGAVPGNIPITQSRFKLKCAPRAENFCALEVAYQKDVFGAKTIPSTENNVSLIIFLQFRYISQFFSSPRIFLALFADFSWL